MVRLVANVGYVESCRLLFHKILRQHVLAFLEGTNQQLLSQFKLYFKISDMNFSFFKVLQFYVNNVANSNFNHKVGIPKPASTEGSNKVGLERVLKKLFGSSGE